MAKTKPHHSKSISHGAAPSRGMLPVFLAIVACFALGAGTALVLRHPDMLQVVAASQPIDRTITNAFTPAPAVSFVPNHPARSMPLCGSGPRINCIVDGDTLWLNGEKIRIVNIDAPEVAGRCRAESVLAANAKQALAELLSNRPIRVSAEGQDRYGRTLAAVTTPEGDVGEALVARRLAVDWHGRKEPAETWCSL